jgi:hypothetical protein
MVILMWDEIVCLEVINVIGIVIYMNDSCNIKYELPILIEYLDAVRYALYGIQFSSHA